MTFRHQKQTENHSNMKLCVICIAIKTDQKDNKEKHINAKDIMAPEWILEEPHM